MVSRCVCALGASLALVTTSCGNDVAVEYWATNAAAGGASSTAAGGGVPTSTTASNGGAGVTTSSSTSTATTFTTSTTTTSFGPGLCNMGNCIDCVVDGCTVEACTTEVTACENNDECAELRACIASCDMESVCIMTCRQMYPGGFDVLIALRNCELCVACWGDCVGPGSSDFCPIVD